MRHLSDGALRRLYDEPHSLDEARRAHYNGCSDCQARFTVIADEARRTQTLLTVPAATVDPAAALARLRAAGGQRRSRLAALRGIAWRRPALGGAAAAAVAAVLVATMAFTPLAGNLQRIFQPSQVTTVSIGSGDLTGLDAFSTWGDVSWTNRPQLTEAESAAEAARISGLPELQVDQSKLPTGLGRAPVSYAAVGQSTGTVTFNANAPAKLRGSTLTVQIGPAETAIYGDLAKLATAARTARSSTNAGSTNAAPAEGRDGNGPSAAEVATARDTLQSAGPLMAVAEMRAPVVSSTGVSVAEIKSVLLAQPGLSPAVRLAISTIDDPRGTLPIPIPAGQVNAHSVHVQGVSATALGDNTGLGSAVIWIKNGRVYGMAGTVTENDILAAADSVR